MFDGKDTCAAIFLCGMLFGHPFKLEKCDSESTCVSQNKDAVIRDDKTLIIKSIKADHGEMKFIDEIPTSEEKESQVVRYQLEAYDESRRIFILQKYYYEDSDFIVVDRNSGTSVDVDSFPEFSPEGSRFVCIPFMGGPWGKGYSIGIWSAETRGFREEINYNDPPEEGNFEWSFVR